MATDRGFTGAETISESVVVGMKTFEQADAFFAAQGEAEQVANLIEVATSYDVGAVLATLRDGADAADSYYSGTDAKRCAKLRKFADLMTAAIKELA